MSPTVPKQTRASAAIGPGDPSRFVNRELSQLDFLDRLLDLAEDDGQALLERAKFLAIFSTNFDDFFQTRVAGLKDQLAAGLRVLSPDGRSPAEQLEAIRHRVLELDRRSIAIFHENLVPSLAAAGVRFSDWESLDDDDRSFLVEVFHDRIFPVLTPLAVDPAHPFPYISSLSLNLGVVVTDPVRQEERFARVKVPPLLPRFVVMPDGERFVPLEQVIAAHLDMLFPEMVLGRHVTFRVTRNADAEVTNGEADDLLAAVEMELRRRRFGEAVRLEVEAGMPAEIIEMLVQELAIGSEDVYESEGPLALGGLWALYSLDRSDLHDEPWTPVVPPRLVAAREGQVSLFSVLAEQEIFVQHPYDSFSASVEELVAQAAHDPATLAIKQTLYRTSGDSPIVASLIEAAESGKQVAVLVELKARFDEQANIGWARALEEAGVHVVYGLVGLKTHAKAVLVVRSENDGIRRYCHVGTGNYNSNTAGVYEDLGLLSADGDLGEDLTNLFNYLTGFGRQPAFRRIVASPHGVRSWCLSEIAREAAAGPDGLITIKVNGLTDPGIIDALYSASGLGTRIDLVVRGLCSLRPGVPALSENITVRSIVGRFLEHSRIYRFGRPRDDAGSRAGGNEPRYFIGSADLMERNLDRRVEVLAPVTDPDLRSRLDETIELNLADDASTWVLGPAGQWTRVASLRGLSTQRSLQELAVGRSRRRRSSELHT